MKADYDIAVIGSGFAGSLIAMIGRRLGRSVVLIERDKHPRFVIGESSTPLANLLLEQLACRYDLPRLLPLAKWGSWQQHYPEIACGLKRGFTFYYHQTNVPGPDIPDRQNQLLVAASPRDAIADTHWYRPDFDYFLVREAQAKGVEYADQTTLQKPELVNGALRLHGERLGQPIGFRAKFVIDATGPRGFLHQGLGLTESPLKHMPPTQALFSHFRNVTRWDSLIPSDDEPPYPVDDAAVHHVFDGGWIWVLRFNNGITSAGIAATAGFAKQFRFHDRAAAWDRILRQFPRLRRLFAEAIPVVPFGHLPRLSFRGSQIAGPQWALLPSCAGFVDPLLSTGFPLALLGIRRLAEILETSWNTANFSHRLATYERQTRNELLCTAQLIAALYANLNNFELFAPLTLLYFAAASYSETVHRLDRPELAPSFLLHDHPAFGPRLNTCTLRAIESPKGAARPELIDRIYDAVELIDVAGLRKRERRNWHPVSAENLFEAAPKLGVEPSQIAEMLKRCGFR